MVTGGTTDDIIQLNIESFVGYRCSNISLAVADRVLKSGPEARLPICRTLEAILNRTMPRPSEMNSAEFEKQFSNLQSEKPIVRSYSS